MIAAIISVAAGKSYAAVRSLPPMIAMQRFEEAQAEWRESNCWDHSLRDFIPCKPDYVCVMQESKVLMLHKLLVYNYSKELKKVKNHCLQLFDHIIMQNDYHFLCHCSASQYRLFKFSHKILLKMG